MGLYPPGQPGQCLLLHTGGHPPHDQAEIRKDCPHVLFGWQAGCWRGTTIASYGASKAGIINLTFTLARELVSYNIRVNSVSPGIVEGTLMRASASPESSERAIQKLPMKRFGKPSEVAEAVYFLVSPASSYITGEVLDCNGGALMD